jgi:hypothetical protein
MRWDQSGVLHVQAKDLLTKVRLRIRDMQKTKISDYELMSALNDAVEMLWIALAERFSSIPRTSTILQMVNGSAPLPKDFYSLIHVQKDAVVNGLFVESEDPYVKITYNRLPTPAVGPEDAVEVPVSMTLDVVEITAALSVEGMGDAVGIASSSAARIAQKREHGAVKDGRPFP